MAKKAPMTLATMKAAEALASDLTGQEQARDIQPAPKLRGYNVRMDAESLHVLKRAALDHKTTMRAIIIKGMNDWLAQHGIAHSID